MDLMRLTPAFALFVLASACSSSNGSTFAETRPEGGTDLFGNGDGGNLGGDGGSQAGCSESAKLVYVLSQERGLYSFNPGTLTFKQIGTLNCPTAATPNSMAVDRQGTAWVNYDDGRLYKVSTSDASCATTTFQPGQSQFMKFGMAFSSDAAGSEKETLYVASIEDPLGGGAGGRLAKIDLSTMKLTVLGNFTGSQAGQGAELTGTGDAHLFGFFTTQPAELAQIDKSNGATSGTKSLTGVSTGDAWAFSFWGGDFWFYTADLISTSQVTRLKTATDGSISVVKSNLGFRIVGAGVSTCAPTTPPK
jgi:hypothetical protein